MEKITFNEYESQYSLLPHVSPLNLHNRSLHCRLWLGSMISDANVVPDANTIYYRDSPNNERKKLAPTRKSLVATIPLKNPFFFNNVDLLLQLGCGCSPSWRSAQKRSGASAVEKQRGWEEAWSEMMLLRFSLGSLRGHDELEVEGGVRRWNVHSGKKEKEYHPISK